VTGAEALAQAVPVLQAAGVDGAARDARLLLAHAVGVTPDRLILILPDTLSDAALAVFNAVVTDRARRRPLAHLTGQRMFWGRSFTVTQDVLDPRPETETLVAHALQRRFTHVLDLGTGSGAILLSLLADRTGAAGLGTDVSPAALLVAQGNARRLGVAAQFLRADWFAGVEGSFDLIVSNPPYIAASEMAALAPEVRDWEPHLALTPGGDGLGAYRAITLGVRAHLAPGGTLMVEIGPSQGGAVQAMFRAVGLAEVEVLADLDGRDRVVRGVAASG
jgi:release factor glutamine methyltransferase